MARKKRKLFAFAASVFMAALVGGLLLGAANGIEEEITLSPGSSVAQSTLLLSGVFVGGFVMMIFVGFVFYYAILNG